MDVQNPEPIPNIDLSRDGTQQQARVPLFLIHDGGGTTFAYHCLDPLHRPAYGLFNPHFHSGRSFEGGVKGMGRLYAYMIKAACAESNFPGKRNPDGRVDILLGGWSMGGLLSFEVAKVLTEDRDVRVIGVLMIDSMCPVKLPTNRNDHLETLDHLDLGSQKKTFALSIQAMKEALRVIREWQPPAWDGKESELRPRFSLLRAADPLPLSGNGRHVIDIYRRDPALGWDRYDPDLFTETMEVEGNHFSMFSFEKIAGISKAINKCCDTLEKLGRL